jgi:replicative DNA helicase
MIMAQDNIIPLGKVTPQSETSERAAISCLLQNFELLNAMSWPEDLFFVPAHRTILATIRELHEAGTPTDFFAVQSRLETHGQLDEIGGMHGLTELATVMPTGDPGVAAWHRATLYEAARYRKALATLRAAEFDFLQQKGDIAAVSLALSEAAAVGDKPRTATKDIIARLTHQLESQTPPEAFGTGLHQLDRYTTGGVKRGELLTIAAPTSGGKSILLVQLALHALRAGKRVVFFSLEMPDTQVTARLLSAMCGFNIKNLSFNSTEKTTEQVRKFQAAAQELSSCHLQVETACTDLESIDSTARELASKGQADLVIVDYIQLVHLRALGSNETREQHVSEITKRLKALALQLNIGVATASQLNEEGKLRESRAIAHHSDHVWLISHPEDGGWVSVNKQRDGERGGNFPILMHGATSQFVERDERKQP